MHENKDHEHSINHWTAVANWYHAYFTGLIMTTVTRRNNQDAADLVFDIFRRQHHARFLPGLKKLNLDGLPPAIASARYHYLSNAIGGVRVEYAEESERKVWVRYPPPRWAWHGTAICAIPSEVSRAVLRGWHAHNGVSLDAPRLGFVCTKQATEGQAGLEGYYQEYDAPLTPDQRLRFAYEEKSPDYDLSQAPQLVEADWPEERVQRAHRNYAMEYVRTALPALANLFGPEDARYLGGVTGMLIGMQLYNETAALLGTPDHGASKCFADFMVALAQAQGDRAECVDADAQSAVVRQHTWKVMDGFSQPHHSVFEIWNRLLEGALSAHDKDMHLIVTRRLDLCDSYFEWRITSHRANY